MKAFTWAENRIANPPSALLEEAVLKELHDMINELENT